MERNDSSLSLSQDFDEEALEEEKSIGWQDVKQCIPTVFVLLVTLSVFVTVLPHVFTSVLKQISDASKLADFRELHNLKDDEEIPWELLQSYMNLTGKQVEREHE